MGQLNTSATCSFSKNNEATPQEWLADKISFQAVRSCDSIRYCPERWRRREWKRRNLSSVSRGTSGTTSSSRGLSEGFPTPLMKRSPPFPTPKAAGWSSASGTVPADTRSSVSWRSNKVQNDFLSVLRSGQKLNRVIAVDERLIEADGKALLIFHVPEARRQDKPIYLDRDIRRSFIRRDAGDERCTHTEIERLLRDAADERHDGGIVDLDPERCFETSLCAGTGSSSMTGIRTDETLSHVEFLHYWGLVVEAATGWRRPGRRFPLRRAACVAPSAAPSPWWTGSGIGGTGRRNWPERWADRLVIETNLVETWKALAARYLQRAEKPFSIDPETLQRNDLPPDYLAFRRPRSTS